jgi:hypothetical protein
MKKHLLYFFLLAIAFTACRKDDTKPIIGNVDERLSATLAEYQTKLIGAEFGWKGYLLTANATPATFLFNFNDKNVTTMAADYKPTPASSSYRLKALQRPTLLFDTYSTLHLLADPTPSVAGGTVADGYLSDFEFAFISESADTIKLEGTFNKSKLLLVRSKSAAESAAVFTSVQDFINVTSKVRTYFKRTTLGGIECELRLDAGAQILSFSYLDGTTLKTASSSFYVSGTKVTLYTPLVIGTTTVTEISDVTFESATGFLNAKINGAPVQIKEAIAPIKLDVGAAQRWYNQMPANFNGCWVSDKAFHANGVDDFCNFKNVPAYQTLWYAGPAVFGGTSEGLITFTGALAAPYALSRTPFTVNAGIARFTLGTNAGTFTGTAPIALAMTAARAIMYGGGVVGNFQDWYLIPTSDDGRKYDMVRVSDAQAWISWRQR